MKPLPTVVTSWRGHFYDQQLAREKEFPLQFVSVDDLLMGRHVETTVAYMRAGFGQDFYSPRCLEIARAEHVLRQNGVRILNDVLGNGRCHRKDVLYTVLAAHGIPVPW